MARSVACLSCPDFLAGLAQLRCLRLVFALRGGEFARQRGTARAFLIERLTMFRRARGQLLSRGCGLLREGSRLLPFLFDRLCAVRGCRLLELPGFLARLAQLRRLRLDLALRRRKFAPQCGAPCAFLVERLTMFRRAGDELLSRSRSLPREGSRFLPLLSERFCGCLRLPPA